MDHHPPDSEPLEVDLSEDQTVEGEATETELSPSDRRWEAGCRGCVFVVWMALAVVPAVAVFGGMSLWAMGEGEWVRAGVAATAMVATVAAIAAISLALKSELRPSGRLARARVGPRPRSLTELFARQMPVGAFRGPGLAAPPAPLGDPSRAEDCGYCQTTIRVGRQRVVCPTCGIPYHPDCWRENGGCGVYGCASGPK